MLHAAGSGGVKTTLDNSNAILIEVVSPKNRNSGMIRGSQANNENKASSKPPDNIRKLSLAAKAGQMQLNSGLPDRSGIIEHTINEYNS